MVSEVFGELFLIAGAFIPELLETLRRPSRWSSIGTRIRIVHVNNLRGAFFLGLSFLLVATATQGQPVRLDSLQQVIQQAGKSKRGVDARLAWASDQIRLNREEAIQRVEEAMELANDLGYLMGEAEAYRLRGILYSNVGDVTQSLIHYDRALEYYSLEQDSLGLGKVFNNFGTYYMGQENLLTAEKYLKDAASLLGAQNVPGEMGKVYNNLGIIKRRTNDFSQALTYYLKALDYQLMVNDESALAGIYNNLGVVYRNLRDYEQALNYYQKSLALKQSLGEMRGVSTAYANIGLLYEILNQPDRALEALEESLALKRKYSDERDQANTLQNIGAIYLNQRQYTLAEDYFVTALEIMERQESQEGMVALKISLARLYRELGKSATSQFYLDEAREALEGSQLVDLMEDLLLQQLKVDSLRNDLPAAFLHINQLLAIKDSAFDQSRTVELARLQSLLQLDEQERENQELREDRARQALALRENETRTNILRGVNASFLLALFFMVWLVVSLRRQQKRNQAYNRELEHKNEEISTQAENLAQANDEINEKNELIERKNHDITDSLNYASQIQRALLPMSVTLQAYLPEHFIFYQPKDIVSGDFYWFHQRDGYLFLAVIDCTGHGVPGAFMSTLGQQALLTAVVQQRLREPAEILDALKVIIRQMLHQDRTQNQDGMDISLLVIEPDRKLLKFAGAKHSLLYITNGTLNEIKGDRMSVGGEHWAVDDRFSQYSIALENDMVVYMTTDGYKDQFGGPENKKFLSRRFHAMLREIHELPMQEQQFRIEQTISRWMKEGEQEQVDDMLVWGMRWRS